MTRHNAVATTSTTSASHTGFSFGRWLAVFSFCALSAHVSNANEFEFVEYKDDACTTTKLSSLIVKEQSSETLCIRLNTSSLPTVGGQISPALDNSDGSDDDFSLTPTTPIVFTSSNWATGLPITVSAADDFDGLDGTSKLTVTETNIGGTVYSEASITLTEDDDDNAINLASPDFTFDGDGNQILVVEEALSSTVTVRLNTRPSKTVTVEPELFQSSDSDLRLVSDANLTFDNNTWNQEQSITIEAKPDADMNDGTAILTLVASTVSKNSEYDDVSTSVTVIEHDDDTARIVVSPRDLKVNEGSSAVYFVSLNARPRADVTIKIASAGDPDLGVDGTSTLTFNATNYSVQQSITVTAAQETDDKDDKAGTSTFTHTATSTDASFEGAETILFATEVDDERAIDPQIELTDPSNNDAIVEAITVTEGTAAATTATFTLKLSQEPDSNTTVTLTAQLKDQTLSGNNALTIGYVTNALTFTSGDYSAAITITVPNDDGNISPDSANLEITATTSTDTKFNGLYKVVPISVEDADTVEITFAPPSGLSVSEGGRGAYEIRLPSGLPTGNQYTVHVTRTGDQHLQFDTESIQPFIFVIGNDTTVRPTKTVYITADADDDSDNGTATFSHELEFGGSRQVAKDFTVTELDSDQKGLIFSAKDGTIVVEEGRSEVYTVALATRPPYEVVVDINVFNRSGGQIGIVDGQDVLRERSLTFGTSNWNMAQSVTVSSAVDGDAIDTSAELLHSKSPKSRFGSSSDDDYQFPSATLSVVGKDFTDDAGKVASLWVSHLANMVSNDITMAVSQRVEHVAQSGLSARVAGRDIPTDIETVLRDEVTGERLILDSLDGPADPERVRSLLDGEDTFQLMASQGMDDRGFGAFWFRGGSTSSDIRSDDVAINASGTSFTLGADIKNDDLLLGLAISRSKYDGKYRSGSRSGQLTSRLDGLFPYIGYQQPSGLSFYSIFGVGRGETAFEPDDSGIRRGRSDLSFSMLSVGSRGRVGQADWLNGAILEMAAQARWARARQAAFGVFPSASGEATHLRIALAGKWNLENRSSTSIKPYFEIGLRHDRVGVVSGYGMDAHSGVKWRLSDGMFMGDFGITTVVAHKIDDYRESTVSASFTLDTDPSSVYGFSARLAPRYGVATTREIDLATAQDLLAQSTYSEENETRAGLDGEVRYGFPRLGGLADGAVKSTLEMQRNQMRFGVGYEVESQRIVGVKVKSGIGAHRNRRDGFAPYWGLSSDLSIEW